MNLYQSVELFTKRLKEEKIPYAVIGGLAMFVYGSERATFDVDFLVHGSQKESVKKIAAELGLSAINENKETIQLAGPTQIDIIFANRELSQNMLDHSRKIGKFPFPVVAPEDLIGLKIQAFVGDRAREIIDKGDILTLIRLLPDLDFKKIKRYADIFNVWTEIQEIIKHK